MKLLIIAGFLGSGKTTMLLQIAKWLSQASQKIAIIENEIGEIGVDGEYLNIEGLQVQELFGGCICCTMSVGLTKTLEKIEQHYKPDLVILEATGIAKPDDIKVNLQKFSPNVNKIKVITLVDAVRWEMLIEMLGPLLTAQIQAADIAAINKIDRLDKKTVSGITKSITQLNPEIKEIITISAEKKLSFNEFLADIL